MKETLANYVKEKVKILFNKFDFEKFDRFDPEISSVSIELYVIQSQEVNGVVKSFVPMGTSDIPKGIRLLPKNQMLILLDGDNKNPLFISREELRLIVKENKDSYKHSIGWDFETAGFEFDYDFLKNKIESTSSF